MQQVHYLIVAELKFLICIVTHADGSRGSRFFTAVCLSVCLPVCLIGNRMWPIEWHHCQYL